MWVCLYLVNNNSKPSGPTTLLTLLNMNTRSAVLLLPFFAFCRNALSQDRAITGKATYEIASDVVHQTLDVWFSSEEYLYQYRQMTDARELPAFKNKKY